MENQLRLILLAIGAVIVIAMILDEMLNKRKAKKPAVKAKPDKKADPDLELTEAKIKTLQQKYAVAKSEHYNAVEVSVPRQYDQQQKTEFNSIEMPAEAKKSFTKKQFIRKKKTAKAEQDAISYVAITVVLPNARLVSRREVKLACSVMGIEPSEDGLMTKYVITEQGKQPLFKVASLNQPGYFVWEHHEDFKMPGLLFYFTINNDINPEFAFNEMIHCARDLSLRFSANLCNEQCELLDVIMFEKLRSRIQALTKGREKTKAS